MQNLGFHTILTSLIWSGTIHPIMGVPLMDLVVWSVWKVVLSIEKVVWWTWKVVWSNEKVVWWIWKEVPVTCCFFRWKILLCGIPFLCLMWHIFCALLICSFAPLTAPQFPLHSKPWNRNSSSRASKFGCRISYIIKKASILEASAARIATNPQNRG